MADPHDQPVTDLLARADEPAAFRALLERTYAGIKSRVAGAMHRKLGPQLDHLTSGPTDLANDVVLRLHDQRKLGGNSNQYFANVMLQVTRVLGDYLRKRLSKVKRRLSMNDADGANRPQPGDHVLDLSNDELAARLMQELDNLSKDETTQPQAQALHLKIVDSLTYDEIAEILGVAGITVRRLIDRGTATLLQRIDSTTS